MDNSVYLYTYGRYGRTGSSATVGDGILTSLKMKLTSYYRYELYQMEAHVFEINDANPILVREFLKNCGMQQNHLFLQNQ